MDPRTWNEEDFGGGGWRDFETVAFSRAETFVGDARGRAREPSGRPAGDPVFANEGNRVRGSLFPNLLRSTSDV